MKPKLGDSSIQSYALSSVIQRDQNSVHLIPSSIFLSTQFLFIKNNYYRQCIAHKGENTHNEIYFLNFVNLDTNRGNLVDANLYCLEQNFQNIVSTGQQFGENHCKSLISKIFAGEANLFHIYFFIHNKFFSQLVG